MAVLIKGSEVTSGTWGGVMDTEGLGKVVENHSGGKTQEPECQPCTWTSSTTAMWGRDPLAASKPCSIRIPGWL